MSNDDFDRTLRARLHDADAWSPVPPELAALASARRTPRGATAGLAALLVVIIAAGSAFALTRGPGAAPASVAQVSVPGPAGFHTPPTAIPTGSSEEPTPAPDVTTTAPAAPPAATGAISPVASLAASASTATTAKSQSATPMHSTLEHLAPQCTESDLSLTVTTSRPTYTQADPIGIDVQATTSITCVANEPEVTITGSTGSQNSLATCHGRVPQPGETACAASLRVDTLERGKAYGAHYDWDMETRPARAGEPPAYLDAGAYTVRYTYGTAKAAITIHVDPAPTCSAADLGAAITTDRTRYTYGETATITVRRTNTSSAVCDLPYGPISTPAQDADGKTVWSGCYATGLPKGDPECSYNYPADPQPYVLTAGAGFISQQMWALDHDGSQTTDPGPVPAGSYSLSYTVDGQAPVTTEISVSS